MPLAYLINVNIQYLVMQYLLRKIYSFMADFLPLQSFNTGNFNTIFITFYEKWFLRIGIIKLIWVMPRTM